MVLVSLRLLLVWWPFNSVVVSSLVCGGLVLFVWFDGVCSLV